MNNTSKALILLCTFVFAFGAIVTVATNDDSSRSDSLSTVSDTVALSNGLFAVANSNSAYPEYMSGVCGDGLTYELKDGVFTVTYDGKGTGVMNTYDKQYFPHTAPWWSNPFVTKVVIGGGVKTIGAGAFEGMPNLTDVEIAGTVGAVYFAAFAECPKLTTVKITGTCGNILFFGAFLLSDNLREIDIGRLDGEFLTGFSFSKNNVAINIGVMKGTYIINEAYEPKVTVGNYATGTCGDGLTYELRNGVFTVTYDGKGTGVMNAYHKECQPHLAPWWNNPYVTKVVIGEGVKTIGAGAFEEMPNLTDVEIASTVNTIGVFAFANCPKLTTVKIPGTCGNISFYVAFLLCDNLKTIDIERLDGKLFTGFSFSKNNVVINIDVMNGTYQFNEHMKPVLKAGNNL